MIRGRYSPVFSTVVNIACFSGFGGHVELHCCTRCHIHGATCDNSSDVRNILKSITIVFERNPCMSLDERGEQGAVLELGKHG